MAFLNQTSLAPARRPAVTNPDPVGFGVYVHWPFCTSKCPYCDFNSHVRHGGIDEPAFRGAFVREMQTARDWIGPRTVTSVFFGGGTPSLMAAETVGSLIDTIADVWSLDATAEITLEANPTSVEATRFRGYRTAGVNRVSLGVQALDDSDLRALGRLHSAAEARAAMAVATASFERVSFDLIYARTGQTPDAWRRELSEALAMSAGHLSLYQLTIEPATPFAALHAAGRLVIPDDEAAAALYEITRDMTSDAGLPLYEVSNHARPGEESRHNLLYWRYGEYVGIGPGAHGRPIIEGMRTATATERNPEAWRTRVAASGDGVTERAPLTAGECADELLLMGLRLAEGIDLNRLAAIGGVVPNTDVVDTLMAAGWIERPSPDRLRVSDEGRFLLNRIALEISASFTSSGEPTASA